jgi:hypothetical protein
MSFLKRLFGGGGDKPVASAPPGPSIEHKGFTIRAEPFPEQGQFQTAGVIVKEIGGETKEHRFVRADRHATREAAEEFSLVKGRLIVDEQGERLFK